jgi:UPF0716 protein FxsA
MFFYLFVLFIVLPVVEIILLVQIGIATRWWVPIAIVVVSGVVGSALARHEGWKVLERMREEMRAGRMPADSLIDAFMILLAGILFVWPGVLTDFVAIGLLIPPIRALIKRGARAWIRQNVEVHTMRIRGGYWSDADDANTSQHDKIIDARVVGTRVEDAKRRS